MFAGLVCYDIHILTPVFNLKEKRRIIKSRIDKIKNRFNVSISEVGNMDLLQRSMIGISCVSNEKNIVQKVINSISEYLGSDIEIEIIEQYFEYVKLP
jgi:uncharacterized protein YlxP (DUF503 family)